MEMAHAADVNHDTQPDPEELHATQSEQCGIDLSVQGLHQSVLANACTLVVDAKLRAPTLNTARTPLTVVCSVDRSASMRGEKTNLVKSTLRFLVSQLTKPDRFGLVIWDDEVQVQFALSQMDDQGKQAANEAIGSFDTQGCTNLSGGLLQGIQTALEDVPHSDEPRTTSVLLFTDGLANRGIEQSEKITEMMRGVVEASPSAPPTVFTFGFGADHDPDMLRAISDQGQGLYYFIEDKEAIPQTFADCLGGLLSVVGQNIRLTIESLNGVSVKQTMTKYGTSRDGSDVIVQMGDLYSEEKRDVLFELELPAMPEGRHAVVKCSLQYLDTTLACPIQRETVFSLDRVESIDGQLDKDEDVAAQYGRYQAAKAMEEANRLGKQGHYQQGQDRLRETQQALTGINDCEELIKDLEECSITMQDRYTYDSLGSKNLMNYACQAHYQRSCAYRSDRLMSHTTSLKSAMCASAKDWEANDVSSLGGLNTNSTARLDSDSDDLDKSTSFRLKNNDNVNKPQQCGPCSIM